MENSVSEKVTILLTACVNPNGMSFTLLQNSELRLLHYINALNFYLINTDYKIVIVENTGVDLSTYVDKSWFENDRLEVLCFEGNNYNSKKGKGYGEALIIKYAFEHSKTLMKSEYILKITGRYIILNITNTLMHYRTLISNNTPLVAVEDIYLRFKVCSSECILAPAFFYKDYFLPHIDRIDDSTHFYFENLLFESIKRWKVSYKLCVFKSVLNIDAISGSNSTQINRNLKDKIRHWGRRLLYLLVFNYNDLKS